MIALPAVASMIAGCADSRTAATNTAPGAQASSENTPARRSAPYQTSYGLSSDGPTTDLYTELFRTNARDDRNAPATVSSGTVPQGQPATASSAVQQETAPPASTTVYGISSNGMTTDLYTELFGPRSHE
jgi:hypothetical protein